MLLRSDSRPTGMMGLRVTDTGAGEDMQRGHVRVNLTAVGMSINFLDVTMTGGTAKSAATDAPMVQSSAQSQPGWVGELSTYM